MKKVLVLALDYTSLRQRFNKLIAYCYATHTSFEQQFSPMRITIDDVEFTFKEVVSHKTEEQITSVWIDETSSWDSEIIKQYMEKKNERS